jgi:hypothetical protein
LSTFLSESSSDEDFKKNSSKFSFSEQNKYNDSLDKKSLNNEKKEKIITLIQEDYELWNKILTFQKVDLKEVKEVINKKGILIENENLKEFLIGLGVLINNQTR